MKSDWVLRKINDIAFINPRETLPKGQIAKKISMDKLQPFCRDVPGVELEPYSGGAKFRNGDTIMARITPCLENGKTAKVNVLDEDEVGFGSTEYIVFRAKPAISDPDYLYYLVTSPLVRDPAIKSMVGSSGRQRVQTDVVQNLEISVPDIPEQTKIASVLKSIDDLIALNTQVMENVQTQTMTIYKSWFVDFDIFEKDESGKPYGIEETSLADLMDYAGGSQPPAEQFIHEEREGYVRFVQIRDYETSSHLTYIPVASRNKLCDEHDIMIARYGASLGRICYGINGAYNVALAKVYPKKPFYREYLRCYLNSPEFYEGINNRGGRSAQAGFNQSDIKSFKLLFPVEEEILVRFENIVEPMFEQMLLLRKQNEQLGQLRDKILPKLITGELNADMVQI